MKTKYITFIFLMICELNSLKAQEPQLKNYNVKDGLPSSETYVIRQNDDGYMYIGTDRGLVRYDGSSFKTLTTADGLTDNTIFNLFKHNNKLWYYTYSTELGYLSADKKFHNYKYNSIIQKKLSSLILSNLMFSDNGEILFNAPVYDIHKAFRINSSGQLESNLYENKGFLSVYIVPHNMCFLTGDMHATRMRVYDKPGGRLLAELANNATTKMAFAGHIDGKTILHANQSIYAIDKNHVKKITDCPANAIYMFIDSKQDIWICFKFHGVYHYKRSNNYKTPEQLLPGLSVSGITEDKENGMWFTTLENGIYYLSPQRICSYTNPGTAYTKTVNLAYVNNAIYARMSDYSLLKFDLSKQKWKYVFGQNKIYSIASSGDSLLLYTARGKTPDTPHKNMQYIDDVRLLCAGKYAWATGLGIKYHKDGKVAGSIPAQTTIPTCGLELDGPTLLAGTVKGLFLYRNDSLVRIQTPTIGRSRIAALTLLNKELILVCTQSDGLYILRLPDYKIVKHLANDHNIKNLIYNTVHKDADNVVWLGTNNGVCKIKNILSNRPEMQWININHGLASNEVYDIVSAKDDTWIATAEGISIIPPGTHLTYEYKIPLVLQSVIVNGKQSQTQRGDFTFRQNNITISFKGLSFLYAGMLKYKYRLVLSGNEPWKYTDNPVINYNNLRPGQYRFEFAALTPNQAGKTRYGSYIFVIRPPFWQTSGFILLSILIFLGGLYLFIHLRLRFVKKQLKLKADLGQYRDKALRGQMSPHFIYNSLNAIQNYIVKHDEDASITFLSKFSKLMRLIFHNTDKELVTVEKDIEALKLYIEMERMRFPGKFEVILPTIPGSVMHAYIPPLILQPFVENAILHGILPSDKKGTITIDIRQSGKSLHIIIKDNGIGRKAAKEIKANKHKFIYNEQTETKEHSATTVTAARIAQAWGITTNAYFSITDLYNNEQPSGTLVEFYLPLHT